MSRRGRARVRARRGVASRPEPPAPARASEAAGRTAPRGTFRGPRPVIHVGTAKAAGTPSPALEKAAVAERTYVMRDFRRIAVVAAIMTVLLVAGGFAVNAFLP